jgi:hypothetical protein
MNARDVDFAERAAILEFDGGLSRAEAEKQALTEIYNVISDGIPSGVLGELIAADRLRRDMRIVAEVEGTFGHIRFPWGLGWVVAEGKGYRPAASNEPARAAFIVPAVVDGLVVDLVAQSFGLRGICSRLGVTSLVGSDDVEAARTNGQPLYIFSSIPQWLKGGGRGAVVVDWQQAAHELDGVPAILCSPSIADRLFSITRECMPAPVIATPSDSGVRRAA